MRNNTPFSTIDTYDKACYNLYLVVQSLFSYPDITEDEIEDLEGKLYAMAFTYICHDYLNITIDQYPYDDFDELVNIMNFELHKQEIVTMAKACTSDPEDLNTIYSSMDANAKLSYKNQ